ncbi:MAG: hypothetical protein B6D61_14405 [Bacteroidetes bacterium 4484_249]|nr:MAG: hypothetical protein B6D61_14405 [Bacteroidetes bacterium 4484_249]
MQQLQETQITACSPLHPFDYCTFQESPAGGTLLSVNNDQTVTVNGAVFPENTWGGAYNISRILDQGHITFTNVEGTFVGDRYENDTYNRVDWPGVVAGIWTGLISQIWDYSGNWEYNLKPYAGDDVYIPAGTPNDCWVSSTDHECNNITIDSGAMLRIYDEVLTVHGDMLIYGTLKMDHSAGVLNAGDGYDNIISWESGSSDIVSYGTINVYGQWYFQNGTNAQLGAGNTVAFYGGNSSNIYCYDNDAGFGNITMNKTSSPHDKVNIVAYTTVKVAEDFYIGNGKLFIDQGSTLQIGNELYVDDDCTVESFGIAGKEARITGYPDNCLFEIASGGTISAEYTIFEYLGSQGLIINPGAIVDTNHAFTSCTFRDAAAGGSLITINNDQDFTVDGAIFPANTWSGTYNAVKTVDQGHVTFTNVTGEFAGENYENDNYNRIDWFTPWYDLNIRVFLEGPFNTSMMSTDLSSVIPLSQPYNTAPWNYNGTESVSEIPIKIVDWVLIELHDAVDVSSVNAGTVIARRAAFLKNNGYISDLDGSSLIQLNESINHNLFLVVWHRNHIGIMSAYQLLESDGVYTYDFSISADRAYGDADAHIEIAPGIWGMAGGNGNPDFIINTDDYNLWKPEAGKTGYKMEDFNLDKQVDNKDKNDIWLNSIGIECWIPE